MVNKFQHLKDKEYSSDLSSFMIAKVDTVLEEPCIVKQDTKLIDAIEKSIEFNTSTIIIEYEEGYGIITDSLLKMKVLLKGQKSRYYSSK